MKNALRDPAKIKFGTYNLLNLYMSDSAEEEARYLKIYDVIRDLDVDVLAVQEVVFKHEDRIEREEKASRGLERLAEAIGMNCHRLPGKPAVASASNGFHVGLLWRPGIEPVGEKWGNFGRVPAGVFHSLASLVLDIGGRRIRFASFHGDPFNPSNRLLEAYQILRAINDDEIPGIIGMDGNAMGASKIPLPWSRRWWRPWKKSTYYDPDVYRNVEWFPRISHQISVSGRGQHADRRAAELLESPRFGRLFDCAVLAKTPWEPTTGHWPTDPHPYRRPVRMLTTHHFAEKNVVTAYRTAKTELSLQASDHLPVTAEFQLDRL